MDESTQNYQVRLGGYAAWDLLGDPEMYVWRQPPLRLDVSVTPTVITQLVPTSITVTVKDWDTQTALEGAVVCLSHGPHGTLSWGYELTDANGHAVFGAFPVLQDDPILVTVTAIDYQPYRYDISVTPGAGGIHYEHCEQEGSGGGEWFMGPGQALSLRLRVRNDGNTAASGTVHLWPSPRVKLDLDINDQYRPSSIYIGTAAAHPKALADTFGIPTPWEGYRVEGEPTALALTNLFKVWRQPPAGLYTVEIRCPSASRDTVFSGSLHQQGGFSNVTKEGERDDAVTSGADSVAFLFHGDLTPDRVNFQAKSSDWLSFSGADSATVGLLGSGDTASVVFSLQTAKILPPEGDMAFTVAVHQSTGSWVYSDFSVPVRGPTIEHRYVQFSMSDTLPGNLRHIGLRPVVENTSNGPLDSLTAVIRELSGLGTLLDSTLTWPDLGARQFSESADSALVEIPVSVVPESLRFVVYYKEWFPNGQSIEVISPEDRINTTLGKVTGVVPIGGDHAFTVYWNPLSGASDYEVQIAREGGAWFGPGGSGTQGRVSATTSLEITQDWTQLPAQTSIQPLDQSVPQKYLVRVRGIGNGNPGPFSDPVPAYAWWPEHPGWPQVVAGGGQTSPTLLDVDGDGRDEVFAAGQGMYAWQDDGTPLGASNPFYTPPDVTGTDQVFVEALSVDDIDLDERFEIVGNMRHRGTFCVEITPSGNTFVPTLAWSHPVSSLLSAPVLADLEEDGYKQVLLPSDSDTLFIWNPDGSSFDTLDATMTGRFAHTPNGAKFNYRSVVAANIDPNPGVEIVMSTSNTSGSGSVTSVAHILDPISTSDYEPFRRELDPVTGNDWLSTPVVADLGIYPNNKHIILTRRNTTGATDGEVSVVNAYDGLLVAGAYSSSWLFRGPSTIDMQASPIVADLDGGNSPEIIVAGSALGSGMEFFGPLTAKAYVFHLPEDPTTCGYPNPPCTLQVTELTATLPVPGRREQHCIGYASPMVADLNGDGCRDILMSTSHGSLVEWSGGVSFPCGMSSPLTNCGSENGGTPHIFGDVSGTPAVGEVDGDGLLELAVQSEEGFVHVFDVAGEAGCNVEWSMYGNGPTHNPVYTGGVGSSPRSLPQPLQAAAAPEVKWTPNPARESVSLELRTGQAGPLEIKIIDAGGRAVWSYASAGALPAGQHEVIWNRTDSNGLPMPSGVYFATVKTGGKAIHRKMVLVR